MKRSRGYVVGLIVLALVKVGYSYYQSHHTSVVLPATTTSSTTTSNVTTSTQPNVPPTPTTWPSGLMAQAITLAPTADGPLAGKTVLVDPGHNGANWAHPEVINQQVPDGRSGKSCDTTGTATASGYAESAFSFDVAQRLQVLLRNAGATVVMTRSNNSSVGPCVNSRAALGDGADVAISIHGDGGPSSGHGFAVLVPVATSVNRAIVSSSLQLGHDIVTAFSTVMPVSTYLGSSGVQVRSDLAGLNLSTVPKVFIECGNMRNAGDAATMASANWRQSAASSLATSITNFLTRGN